jgi:hypothetical protein
MTDTRAPARDRTVVLRRQPARIINRAAAGEDYPAYEIICRLCGDDPSRDYHDLPPRLQRLRGPYWLLPGVRQYEAHLQWHEATGPRGQPAGRARFVSDSPPDAPLMS